MALPLNEQYSETILQRTEHTYGQTQKQYWKEKNPTRAKMIAIKPGDMDVGPSAGACSVVTACIVIPKHRKFSSLRQ